MSLSDIHIVGKSKFLISLLSLPVIVFLVSCNPYGENAIFLYDVDNYPAYQLVWSPTGRYIAFTSRSTTSNASSIYILDIKTKEAELFMTADYGHLVAGAWTPDETELVFFANSSNEFSDGIWIAPVNNSNPPKLYLDEEVAFSWSPTNQIAIGQGVQTDKRSIYIQDLNTEEEKTVFLDQEGSLGEFSWAADGTKIAFSLNQGVFRRRDIYIIDLEALQAIQLTDEGANDSPSLSPNGNMIAYTKGDFSGATPSYPLHIMNSDGTCDREVSDLKDVGSPAWSPDGRWIAFVGKGNRIFMLDVFATFGEDFLIKGLSCN